MKCFEGIDAKALCKEHNNLKAERAIWDSRYSAIQQHFFPFGSDFPNRQTTNGEEIITNESSVPRVSVRTLVSYLFAYANPTSNDWAKYENIDASLNKDETSNMILDNLSELSMQLVARSNFYMATESWINDWAIYGTATLLPTVKDKKTIIYKHVPLNQSYIAENYDGMVDKHHREYELTHTQLLKMLKDKEEQGKVCDIPQWLIEKVEVETKTGTPTKLTLVYVVSDRKLMRGNKEYAYSGILISQKDEEILSVDYFDEFPYIVSRFSQREGEVYGRSTTMDALCDARIMHRLTVDELDGIEFNILPPAFVKSSSDIDLDKFEPGTVVPYDDSMGTGGPPVTFMTTNSDLQSAELLMQRLTLQIEKALYLDVFQALQGRTNMSATEVVERSNERVQTSMMFANRLKSEFHEPILMKNISYIRNGDIEFDGLDVDDLPSQNELRVKCTSLIDSQIKRLQMDSTMSAVQAVSGVVAAFQNVPQLEKYMKELSVVDNIMDNFNIPFSTKTTKAERDEVEKRLIAAAQARQKAELEATMAKNTNPNTPVQEGSIVAGN